MSEIPQDIEEAALAAWTSVPTADWEANAVDVIAKAIYAERRRCMSGWKPMDAAPKDGTHVLLYFPDGYWADDRNISVGFWGVGDDWFDSEASSGSMTAFGSFPTHWMPLPSPPETDA